MKYGVYVPDSYYMTILENWHLLSEPDSTKMAKMH